MTEHRGRDNQESPGGDAGERSAGVDRRRVDIGMPGGERAVRSEAVDFDAMGDLDMGADDAEDAEVPTGPGPGYGMPAGEGRDPAESDEQTSFGTPGGSASVDHEAGTLATPGDFAATMRVADAEDITGGMGSGVGDEDGISQGIDMDAAATRGDAPSTGTGQRAGLGGRSRGTDMDLDPAAGSGMANPADMGPQS